MKYTKKYPIHPLPDKKFSGASIFAQGGQLPGDDGIWKYGPVSKQDSVKNIAGNISLFEKNMGSGQGKGLDNYGWNNDPTPPTSVAQSQQQMLDTYTPRLNPKASAREQGVSMDFLHNANIDLEPYAYQEWLRKEGYLNPGENWESRNVYRNAQRTKVINPSTGEEEWQNSGKWNDPKLKSEFYNMYNNSVGKLPEPERRDLLEKGKDWFLSNLTSTGDAYKNSGQYRNDASGSYVPYNQNPASGLKHDYKKAFGGFKYPNGGSFYDSSNINTSKPQVNNTVPSSYTEQFRGNSSSVPKTTKDGINFSKDGKALTGSFNTNSSGSFSGNYLGMATAAVGGIGNTVNNANAATNEQDKNRAIERGTVDTTMNIVDTAFPIVGAVEGVAGGIGAVIDSTNPSTSYTDPNTGKTYNYKKGDSGTSAAGFKAAVDPRGNATNFIGDITGTTENYGQSDFGMGVADLFAPFLSQAFRNKQAEKAANQAQMNNSLMNAQGVDSTARNFSAFGGYKNKFPYGGNMKSEVTGQSYLKDQISDFAGNNFKTHAEGGANIDSTNQVEKDEVIYNDYVYSARLKNKDGIPFSTIARRLKNQIKEQHG